MSPMKVESSDTNALMNFANALNYPIMMIYSHVSGQASLTRQYVVDILQEQWKKGENGWENGWAEYALSETQKEHVVGVMHQHYREKGILLLKSAGDARLIGRNTEVSERDFPSTAAFLKALQENDDILGSIRARHTHDELLYLALEKYRRKAGGDFSTLARNLIQQSNTQPTIKKTMFGFGSKIKSIYNLAVPIQIPEEGVSLSTQLGVYHLNKDHPKIKGAASISDTSKANTLQGDTVPQYA